MPRLPLLPFVALALLLLGSAGRAAAQEGSVAGRVVSAAGQPVEGASVTAAQAMSEGRRSARTGAAGTFRFERLAPGRWTVRASRLGFATEMREIVVAAGEETRVELRLTEGAVELEGIDVTARRAAERERARFETEAGVTARVIGGRELKVLPGLGEADVMRAVEVLPGVVSTSDFSSAFNVRGGSADQNLILLDGFPIFNPFHLGGLFSVFNSDVIARAELLAGGFGAEYGGRVSSVLNVETVAPTEPGLSGDVGVSLLATRVGLRGALSEGTAGALGGTGGGWLLSLRRSYFDALLAPVTNFPYHLTDGQLGATLNLRGGGRLRFTGYAGEDVLDLSEFDPPGAEEDEESILRIRWNWGNQVAGVRWEQPVGRSWVMDTRLGFSRYAEALGFVDFSDTRFSSEIEQLTFRADLGRQFGPALTLRTGVEANRLAYRNRGESGGTTFFDGAGEGLLSTGFAQLSWAPGGWIFEPGARLDVWTPRSGRTQTLASPRLAVKRFFGPARDAAAKIAVGRYVQFVHSLRDESLPVSNDNWVIADDAVPAVLSDQVQVGVEKYWGDRWNASVEAYYRDYRNVTDFNVADDPNDPDDDLLRGEGFSYGLDVMVRRMSGRLTGWTAVSLLQARRTFPDPTRIGVDGEFPDVTFAPVFDRRVDVDVVLQYEMPGRVQAGLRWNYGSGLPYSRPTAQFAGFETDVIDGGYRLPRPTEEEPDVPFYVVPGRRNAERYPGYHRLDLTVRRTYERRWGRFTPYVQVLNAYNRRNVLFYFYDYDGTPPTRSGLSMFPVLPALGVEASF